MTLRGEGPVPMQAVALAALVALPVALGLAASPATAQEAAAAATSAGTSASASPPTAPTPAPAASADAGTADGAAAGDLSGTAASAPPSAVPPPAPPPTAASDDSTPPPPAPVEAERDASAEILAQLSGSDEPLLSFGGVTGPSLQVYGFADFSYRHLFVADDNPWLLFLNREGSFWVGNFNVYFDGQIHPKWRALAEVRFTYLPHGAPIQDLNSGQVTQVNASYPDYTDYTRNREVGGVMIQRVHLDWQALPFLAFRAGQWLTPYGIWNVDHGTPTIIGVTRPFIIGARLLPEWQVGLLAYGTRDFAEDWSLNYQVGLSNGRPDASSFEDFDGNKAVTARAALSYFGGGELTLGATFYAGQATRKYEALGFASDGDPISSPVITEQFDEISYAFDLKWLWKGVHFQTEWIINDRAYTDDGRPAGPNGGLRADVRNWGGYGLLGYRLPWFPLMPYFKGEFSPEPQSQSIGVADKLATLAPGLNYRIIPAVAVKLEYTYAWFPDDSQGGFAEADIHGLDMQLAWAF